MSAEIPSFVNLAPIITGGPGSSGGSLLVTTQSEKNTRKYLFNCGEGLSRHVDMRKRLRMAYVRLANLQNIFITHKRWETTAGLLGCALTLDNSAQLKTEATSQSAQDLNVYGPDGVENSARMARKLHETQHLMINKGSGVFDDGSITITPVVFYDSQPRPCIKSPDSDSDQEDSEDSRGTAFAYICKLPPRRPNISKDKLEDLELESGPNIGLLKRGISVTLVNGRVITPDMVTEKMYDDNRPFLVVDCPTLTFLESLSTNTKLEEYMTTDNEKSFMIVVHMTPSEVYHSEQYQAWMKRTSPSTHHIVLNKSSWGLDPTRVRAHQTRLHIVDPELFPSLNVEVAPEIEDIPVVNKISNKMKLLNGNAVNGESIIPAQGRVIKACPGLVFVLRSKYAPHFLMYPEGSFIEDVYLMTKKPEFEKAITQLKETLSEEAEKQEKQKSYPKIVFLGTASAEPNRVRAQSCILVQISKTTIFILDCGEDSYGQLYRFYGKDKAARVLTKVKAIFVSHMHLDHYLGLFTLLMERKKAFDVKGVPFSPVCITAPIQMRKWLFFYHYEMEPITHLFKWMHHQSDWDVTDRLPTEEISLEDLKEELHLHEYLPVPVIHCKNAYGLTFTLKNGMKVTYSGDTTPCNELVTAGKDSDILIHEATHEDQLIDLAKVAKHSTFSQAINVGKRMRAKHVILTHFSQRYSFMLPLGGLKLPGNLGVAFDNMFVEPSTLHKLPKIIPALLTLFHDELEVVKLLQKKRKVRMEQEKQNKKKMKR